MIELCRPDSRIQMPRSVEFFNALPKGGTERS